MFRGSVLINDEGKFAHTLSIVEVVVKDIRLVISRRMKLSGHVALMVDGRGVGRGLFG